MRTSLTALGLALAMTSNHAPQPGVVLTEFVFEHAPFASAHASTIAEGNHGLVAAWFGGSAEGATDVGIWVSRRTKGGWTAPVEVANGRQQDGTRFPCWNPVLFQPARGALMLFYKVGPNPREWWGMVRTSFDGGLTWSDARRLPDGILGPTKNKPVQLRGGEIIAPSSTEGTDAANLWRVHFERSVDQGKSWSIVTPATSPDGVEPDAIQPSILVHDGGTLQALVRTRSSRIFQTWSSDAGKSWGPLTSTGLPNPNSGIDAVTLRDGRFLLVYNHATNARSPLNVAMSRDGTTWEAAAVLETGPGEYSYPAVIQTRDGLVHVTYTWNRKRIRHVVLDPAKVTLSPLPKGFQ